MNLPENLERLYVIEGKSCAEIGKLIGKSRPQVWRYLKTAGIEMRPFSRIGIRHTIRAIELNRNAHLGKIHTDVHKMRIGSSGKRYWNSHVHPRKGKVSVNKGMHMTEEQKMKISAGRQGISVKDWGGFITSENQRLRHVLDYKFWREAVFARDNFTCQHCGERANGYLNADHIKPFAFFPELRYAIDNGRTLCIPCHKKTPTFGSKVYKFKPIEYEETK